MAAHHIQFNEKINVRVFKKGEGKGDQFAGGYGDILGEYSDQLKGLVHTTLTPTDFDVNNLVNIKEAAQLKHRPRDMSISDWHVKPDGMIYQGNNEHSSKVVRVEGQVVFTSSGSRYYLLNRDKHIKEVMNLIVSCFSDYPIYNSADPLSSSSIPLLLAAELICYGSLANRRDQILQHFSEYGRNPHLIKISATCLNPYSWVLSMAESFK